MDNLYPYLILVGGSILLATAWLLYRARVHTKQGQTLVKLNESLSFDLPDFLRQCWPVLEEGGFTGLSWRLDWFGATISGVNGVTQDGELYQHFEVQEITLDIRLYHKRRGWEQRYFTQVLADNFFLLVRMDIWIKLGTTRGTFDQTAKMNVFLQHDMKNLVQLVSLAADQLQDVASGTEARLLSSLQKSVPAIRDRATHMLNTLMLNHEPRRRKFIQLANAIQQSAAMFDLTVCVLGDGEVHVSEEALQGILENLLGNYAWQARKEGAPILDLVISILSGHNDTVIEIEDKNGKPCLWPERLFEPFWSERGSGRGIGLYQARQMAIAQGGNLVAVAKPDEPLKFVIKLPNKV